MVGRSRVASPCLLHNDITRFRNVLTVLLTQLYDARAVTRANSRRNGDLSDGSRLERLVVDVWLNVLDDRVWDVVLVELEQAFQELLRVCQKTFARLPVIVLLLSRLSSSTVQSLLITDYWLVWLVNSCKRSSSISIFSVPFQVFNYDFYHIHSYFQHQSSKHSNRWRHKLSEA